MEDKICKNCVHYDVLYVKRENKYRETFFGFCRLNSRRGRKRALDCSCPAFCARDREEERKISLARVSGLLTEVSEKLDGFREVLREGE